jgi:hypothetical protein
MLSSSQRLAQDVKWSVKITSIGTNCFLAKYQQACRRNNGTKSSQELVQDRPGMMSVPNNRVLVHAIKTFNTWMIIISPLETWSERKEVIGRTICLLSLIRHGPHWKRRVQQFFYCRICIRYRANVSTQPLPSNEGGSFTGPLPSDDNGFLPNRCIATTGGFLPSRCLATIRGFLPNRCLAMIRGFLQSRCVATIRGIHRRTHTQTATWSHKTSFIFSK